MHEILKKVMENCGLKAITLTENTNEFSDGVFSSSKDYFVILKLINKTFCKMTESFNQITPSSLFTVMEVRNKIAFHTI